MKHRVYGTLILLLATVLWGSSYAVRKMAMSEIGPLMQNAARFFAAFCFMAIVLFCYRKWQKRKNPAGQEKEIPVRVQIKYGAIIGLTFGLGTIFQQLGLMTVDAGKVGFVTSLYTVLVPVLSFLFFRQKIRKQVWMGMLLSLIGLFLITSGGLGFGTGYFILLLGSVMFAMQIILIGRFIKDANPLILVTVQLVIGTIVNLALALIIREEFAFSMLSAAMLPILYTGIFSLGIANVCHFISQKMLPPSVAAIVCSFESVFGLVFGVILLGEHMTMPQLAGCLAILTAVIVSQMERPTQNGKQGD